MKTAKKQLIVIAGPTAVGKTAVAIELAHHFRTEIISADSRQIFREMNIGTAKPDSSELVAAKHHLINSHTIGQKYDAAQYGRDALQLIEELFKKYNQLILCGGSGLYIQAVCDGLDDIPNVPAHIREELTANYNKNGIEWLQEKMSELDAAHLNTIDQQNPHRLMRALEVKIGTGRSIASFQNKDKLKHAFDIIKIGLELDRETLYERINLRMDKMIADGLFEEAESLYAYKDHNALRTVGYQEIFDFIDGVQDREETIRLLKQNSRRYAKRQLTWFKRDKEMHWVKPDQIETIIKIISNS